MKVVGRVASMALMEALTVAVAVVVTVAAVLLVALVAAVVVLVAVLVRIGGPLSVRTESIYGVQIKIQGLRQLL